MKSPNALPNANVVICPPGEARYEKAADIFCTQLETVAQNVHDRPIRVALCGGSTPFGLYKKLTQKPWSQRVMWSRLHFFLSDERFVPFASPHSNFGRIHDVLFQHVPVSREQIFPIPITDLITDAAFLYQEELKNHVSRDNAFDIALLGIGEDGHTASIFPNTPSQLLRSAWTMPTLAPSMPRQRLTLTPELLNHSDHIIFFVCGTSKNGILKRLFGGEDLPANAIHARKDMTLLTDENAIA